MKELVNKLKNEGPREKHFRMAYRLTCCNKLSGSGKRKRDGGLNESPPVNYESDIWGLEDIGQIEL